MPLNFGIEHFDLSFQRRDLGVERASAIGDRVSFFFKPGHSARN